MKKQNAFFRGIIISALAAVLAGVSCKPAGPLTPEDAFYELRRAFNDSDAGAVTALLSSASVKKIMEITGEFSRMDNDRIRSVAAYYDVKPERMKTLSVEDYITLYLAIEKKRGPSNTAVGFDIVAVDIQGNAAAVSVRNGMTINFVREGPYWKFDLDGAR